MDQTAYARAMRLASLNAVGEIRLVDAPRDGGLLARCIAGTAFGETDPFDACAVHDDDRWLVIRSGHPAAGEAAALRWGSAAWATLDAFCDSVKDRLEAAGATLCFRPHADDILSDAHACRVFLERRAGGPFEVCGDPGAMLTPAMIPTAPEHVERSIQALASCGGAVALILTNVVLQGERLMPAPITEGILDPNTIAGLARALWPADRPLVLLEQDFASQARLLGG